MYKGTNASSGIGIGSAVIVEEAELVIEKRWLLTLKGKSCVLRERWKPV